MLAARVRSVLRIPRFRWGIYSQEAVELGAIPPLDRVLSAVEECPRAGGDGLCEG